MKSGCNNLKGELARKGITRKTVAEALGVHINTLCNKLDGATPFTIEEAFAIKDAFLPEADLKYLFMKDGETA